MALFNIFKKKKPAAKPKKKEVKKEATEKAVAEKPTEKPQAVAPKPKKISVSAFRVLLGPHVTEKATALTQHNQYVFRVSPRANKSEVKKAVEDVFGVKVTAVRVVRIPAKERRLGRSSGWKQGYKKALVKIAQGQKIEILPR